MEIEACSYMLYRGTGARKGGNHGKGKEKASDVALAIDELVVDMEPPTVALAQMCWNGQFLS